MCRCHPMRSQRATTYICYWTTGSSATSTFATATKRRLCLRAHGTVATGPCHLRSFFASSPIHSSGRCEGPRDCQVDGTFEDWSHTRRDPMLFILVALCCSDSLRVHALRWSGFVVALVATETIQCLRDSPRDGVPHGDHRYEGARSDRRPRARVVFARRNHFPAVAAKTHAVLLQVGVYLFARAKYVLVWSTPHMSHLVSCPL